MNTTELSNKQTAQVEGIATEQGFAIPFPLRPNYVAQIVIPRDLTKEEAKRLSAFINAFAREGIATEQGFAIPFRLRPNYVAQIVIPRDLTKEEAKRLSAFINAFAREKA